MDPFITDLCSFAESEGSRVPELEQPMALLADSLGRVSRLEQSERLSLPVVDDHLAAALDVAEGPVGDLLRNILPDAGWAQPYPEHVGEPDMDVFRAGFGYAPVVGSPENSYRGDAFPLYGSEEVFVGAVLQGPNIVYPSHVHRAVEVYWAASGTAGWQKGDVWSRHGPGATILHEAGVRHATTTGDEAILMMFAWVTDPRSIPVIVRL
ncbi:MAG TPA: dimethylsulfonioproprionate lyase family protein [Acidimicrobiales bacterium]|nr:dimethylsulfonioproprionate lyase family protein [Acidimicrobiales bacterium]MDP7411167.1 dimethylsulfonioproprionate lyase family protein [Acidimicrobiales bacterium]MEE1521443.1 dimethylsulfonioproprionate lyase family protein [Acidimicrobiales bacterium]MEE1570239.1 dimethylsulfonioproprionate lyase family protein [Acidimicrobiales bacterium]HJL83061.1 dimethylsulfonioproprionate lyase family protein [Acidimicrobiales bacterium]